MFDETFIHHAENFSDRDRVILFCDVERPLRYRWAQAVNRFLGYTIVSAASSPNETGDETGGINRVFRFFWHAGAYRRRLKKWSRPVYYLVKFSLIAAAIAFFLWV
jgi:beta-hydroxylase